jgi:hypothetical protein
MRAASGRTPARRLATRRRIVPRLLRLEDRTLPSVQFTPAPYAVPANRPDTPLTSIDKINGGVEPYLTVNPADPGDIAVSNGAGIRVSTSAGGNFPAGARFPLPPTPVGDTCTTYDSAGRLFWINVTTNPSTITIAQVDPSTGGILSRHVVDQVPDSSFSDDKDFIAADPSNNNLYVIWTRFDASNDAQVLMRYSSNQGASWTDPVQVDNGSDNFVWPATVAIAPNHMVYASYHSVTLDSDNTPEHDGKIVVVRFNNDLTDPIRSIAEVPGRADITRNIQTAGFTRQIPGATFLTQGSLQPWILADPARPGNIYVISADSNNGFHQDYGDIRLARSTDYGLTWSSSLIQTSSALFPNAAIDQFGDIVVGWYDNRRGLNNAAGHFKLDVYATYSTDGGLTFAPAFPVNDQTPGVNTPDGNIFDPDPGAAIYDPGPPPTTRIGEYFGIAIWGGTAYVAWNGNHFAGFDHPVDQQVWTKAFAIRGSLTVTGTPGSDDIIIRTIADNPDSLEVIVNGQRQYAGLWSALTNITVNATPGDDYVEIDDTVAGTPVTVNNGNGTDTVPLSAFSEDVDAIKGPVTVHGGSGTNAITFNDRYNTANITYTITDSSVTRTGSALISFTNARTSFFGGSGNDGYHIVGAISTLVNLYPGSGSNTVTIDDGSNTADTTYTVTASAVTWTGSGPINLNGSFTSLVLTGGSGDNSYNVQSTPSGSSTTLNTGGGVDTVNVHGTAGLLTINGAGRGTVAISNGASTLGGIGHVIINEPSNSAAVTVDDSGSAGSTTYTLTSTQVAAAAWPNFLLVYNNLASLNLKGGSGDDSFAVESTASATATTITAGSGSNRFDLTPTAHYLAAVAGPLSLFGSGPDTLVFWDTANPSAETYNFDDIPSNLTLTTVPVSINFFGMAAVYLETNGMSTVNDPSGKVLVDVPPPSPPNTARRRATAPSIAAAGNLVTAPRDDTQERNAAVLSAPSVSDALVADRIAYGAGQRDMPSSVLNARDSNRLGTADQHGVVRSGGVNIGAYQASAFLPSAPDTVQTGVPFDVTVVDPFAHAAVGYSGAVSFISRDPEPGVVLPADYAFQPSDAGQVTFPIGVTLITPGDQTLSVTGTADNTFTGSALVTVASTAPRAGPDWLGQPMLSGSETSPAPAQPTTQPQASSAEVLALDRWLALFPAADELGLTAPGLTHPSRGYMDSCLADLLGREDLRGSVG